MEFFQTRQGKIYFEVTLPKMIQELKENSRQLEISNILKMIELELITKEEGLKKLESLNVRGE